MRGWILTLVVSAAPLIASAAQNAANLLRSGSNAVKPRLEDRSVPAPRPAAADVETKSADKTAADATSVKFYGHGFLYFTTSSGVRIAFDPFPNDPRVGYAFPAGLSADIVLISAESPELSGNDALSGLPQVFRSLTGLGANNANGIGFRGVATYRDASGSHERRGNTSYVIELDRVVFCNLGAIGQGLDRRQVRELGGVDVLFLPVGNLDLSVSELWKIAADTGARWVVPVTYRTPQSASAFPQLRTLEEFLSAPESAKFPRVRLNSNECVFSYKKLPKETTLLIYKSP